MDTAGCTFFVCGLGEEDFCSLTPEQVRTYKQKFFRAEILVGIIDDEPVTLKVAPRIKGHPSKQRDPPDRTAR